jgi:hypothetical protein
MIFRRYYSEYDFLERSASGSASSSGPASGSGSAYDPCATPSDPGSTCERLAQIEGNGSYTQDTNGSTGASGRYQIEQPTAVGEILKLGKASDKSEAISLWQKCRASDAPECRNLQDEICKSYASSLGGSNVREVYLRWNMGVRGANEILEAHHSTGQVTNPVRIAKMDNQAWTRNNPSNGNTKVFLDGLNSYIKKRGIDPMATV